jgi:hypothetical protein
LIRLFSLLRQTLVIEAPAIVDQDTSTLEHVVREAVKESQVFLVFVVPWNGAVTETEEETLRFYVKMYPNRPILLALTKV